MQLFRETQGYVLMSFSWEGKACLGVGSKENFSHRWVFPHSNYFIQSTFLNKKFKMGEKLENEKSSSSYLLFFSAFFVENAGIICRHCWQEKKGKAAGATDALDPTNAFKWATFDSVQRQSLEFWHFLFVFIQIYSVFLWPFVCKLKQRVGMLGHHGVVQYISSISLSKEASMAILHELQQLWLSRRKDKLKIAPMWHLALCSDA